MPVIVQKLPVISPTERAGKMRGQRDGWRYLGETTAMMGTKERSFAPLFDVSLEDFLQTSYFAYKNGIIMVYHQRHDA